jgi:hypothetical protein
MAAKTTLQDDKLYKVKVNRSVKVFAKLQWRPGQDIEATGALIKQLDALPENKNAIDSDLVEVI